VRRTARKGKDRTEPAEQAQAERSPPDRRIIKGSVNEIVMFPSPGNGRRMPYENMTISLTDSFRTKYGQSGLESPGRIL